MQDKSDRFQIRLVHGAAVLVHNGNSIAILDAIKDSDMTLSDISAKTGISTSTVFFNLKSMMDSGLVVSYSDEVNEKKTLYSLSSVEMMGFGSSNYEVREIIGPVIKNLMADRSYFYRGLAGIIALDCFVGGMDMTPIFDHASRLLAGKMKDVFKSDNLEDVLNEVLDSMKAANMPRIEIYTMVPLTLSLHMDTPLDEKFLNIYIAPIGFIMQILEYRLGVRYALTSKSVVDVTEAHFVLTPVERSAYVRSSADSDVEMIIKPFTIVYCGGMHMPVDNINQIQVIDRLLVSDATSSDISRDTGISSQTLYSNLRKMVDSKIISLHVDDRGNGQIYKLDAYVSLSVKPSQSIGEKLLDQIIEQVSEDTRHFYGNLLVAIIHLFDSLNMDFSEAVKQIGTDLAHGLAIDGRDMSESVRDLSDFDMLFGSRISLESYVPLIFKVTFTSVQDSLLERQITTFFDGFFSEFFGRIASGYTAQRIGDGSEGRSICYTAMYSG